MGYSILPAGIGHDNQLHFPMPSPDRPAHDRQLNLPFGASPPSPADDQPQIGQRPPASDSRCRKRRRPRLPALGSRWIFSFIPPTRDEYERMRAEDREDGR